MKATLTVATWIALFALAWLGLSLHEGEILVVSATARWRKKVVSNGVIEISNSENANMSRAGTGKVELVN